MQGRLCILNFHQHRQDHGIALGSLIKVTGQVVLDGGLDGSPVPDVLPGAAPCGGTLIGCECVKKSYPNFFENIRRLGVKWEEIK